MKTPVVSFCTVVMNRLNHLRMTLPANLEQNSSQLIEFVILDYNSQDGLKDYIQNEFQPEINSGQLVYYRYEDASFFHRAHSKNMALRLGCGEVLCSLDADNYAGQGFGEYVANVFSSRKDICLTGLENKYRPDASGKLCVSKSKFMDVTGFDEKLSGYGFDDYDIVNRLRLNGCDPFTINKTEYLNTIPHNDLERLCNESFFKAVEAVYVHFIDPSSSILLYLLQDGSCWSATILNTFTLKSRKPMPSIKQVDTPISQFQTQYGWKQGDWWIEDGSLFVEQNGSREKCLRYTISEQESFRSDKHVYYKVNSLSMKLEAISFFTQIRNREVLEDNFKKRNIRVNKHFGEGEVYKNFGQQKIKILDYEYRQ